MAVEYLTLPRNRLGRSDLTDFALANAVFLADRSDLDLIVYQTAAKERIRWLSAHLAALLSERASLQERLAKALGVLEWFIAHRATVAADLVSAHFARGDAASELMREDDRDLRRDFNDACERASQVHAELHPKDKSE
jgi:hypothetical protein